MPARASNTTAIIDLTASSPPRPLTDAFRDAIDTAPIKELRYALRRTCESSEEASELAQKYLLVPVKKVKYKIVKRTLHSKCPRNSSDEDESGSADEEESSNESEDEIDSENEDESRSGTEDESGSQSEDSQEKDTEKDDAVRRNGSLVPSLKRYRPRYATCENCNEDFDVLYNDEQACIWHPGDKEADYDSPVWYDHDERCHGIISQLGDEYPEGFMYDCCNRPGDSEGCKIGTHVEKGLAEKRARYN